MTAPQRAVVFAAPVMGRIHEMLTCGHTRTRQPGDVPAQSRRCQDCEEKTTIGTRGEETMESEHEQSYAALEKEVERLREWVNDLQSGMFINCVYCGHRYGPNDEVPSSMADVLKEHVEQCPDHPMSALRAKAEALDWLETPQSRLAGRPDLERLGPDERLPAGGWVVYHSHPTRESYGETLLAAIQRARAELAPEPDPE